jgi:hypothetical protein
MATLTLQADKTKAEPHELVAFTVIYDSDIPSYLSAIELLFGDGTSHYWTIEQPTQHYEVSTSHSYADEGVYEAKAIAYYADANNPAGTYVWSNSWTVVVVVEAPIPPPPTLPPPITPTPVGPPTGPPIEVILEPPDERPRHINLPPPVEPPQPIDWRPGPLPPDVTPPPRTRETDVFTLRQFAAKWGHQIDRYALNVPLDGGEVVEDLPEPYRSFWQRLTMHKADIVFERKGIVYVAEIKPRLSRGAIGEAITAHELFKRLYKFPLETRAAVICQTAHPTLIQTASWLDCLVFVTEQVDTGQPPGLYKRIGR